MKPRFLNGVKPSDADRIRYREIMRNYVRLTSWLTDHSERMTPYQVLVMMVVEIERDNPRYALLHRLKGCYDVKRRAIENKQLKDEYGKGGVST